VATDWRELIITLHIHYAVIHCHANTVQRTTAGRMHGPCSIITLPNQLHEGIHVVFSNSHYILCPCSR